MIFEKDFYRFLTNVISPFMVVFPFPRSTSVANFHLLAIESFYAKLSAFH